MFSGTYTAIITPFQQDGSFDKPAYKKIIEEQIAAGVDGIVPMGTTGESPTVSHDESLEIIESALHFVDGRIKVIAGTGSNNTTETIRMTKKAKQMGADGALLVCPYYNKPSQEGIYRHYKTIAESLPDFPLVLYNVPGRTGVAIEPETVIRLSSLSNIICLKDASNTLNDIQALSGKLPKNFTILSGDDGITADLMELGASGVISVASNLKPKIMKSIVDTALSGDFNSAKKISDEWMPYFDACFIEANPIPIKALMAMSGKCEEVYRLPLCEPSSKHRAVLQKYVT